MTGIRRKALLASAVLVGNVMLMTACQDTDKAASAKAPPKAASEVASEVASKTASKTASEATEPAVERISSPITPVEDAVPPSGSTNKGKGSKGSMERDGSGFDTGDGRRLAVEQTCGTNDISWSTRSESRAGGYILIKAKAKAGITCYLPAALPTVAFGSDGTEAGPARKGTAKPIKLGGNATAYAGVKTKTTKGDWGKELDSIIVAVGNDDPDPVSLKVGTITVDKPIVTNWHTKAANAVPLG
ncbi:DUF4232 domain-containing protein [Streptomyces qinzhouensis]|uniref:DUF4232 domain-containing protein n=1 Tax=Streptomyces qinzhouensis TaxID=2599401 RepID=A0A5B8II50_9ACTN|nr:DUF4232 domain-containing protein [Streptomyces qinzhouensis]QDY78002.1 DUF4232 domain-containing protein [Streptomyces qinzhouensis]